MKSFNKQYKWQTGAALVEVALLVALLALIAIPSVQSAGESVRCTLHKAEYEMGDSGFIPVGCPKINDGEDGNNTPANQGNGHGSGGDGGPGDDGDAASN